MILKRSQGKSPSLPVEGDKDQNGAYIVEKPVGEELSIDNLLAKGLISIHRLMKYIDQDIKERKYNRNTIQNLKDCVAMLNDMKMQEKEILEDLTDEALEKLVGDSKRTV